MGYEVIVTHQLGGEKMKILVVDDIEVNLELLEARMEGGGYEVTSAMNGVEALEILKTDSIDIIISDILMPKMDGYQLCRECKRDDTLRKIPFVFYTATYTEKKDEEFAMSLGADRFIVKPMEREPFMETIEEILKNYKKGLLPPSEILGEEEEDVFLKEYNERLINKLEKKLIDLEKEIAKRKRSSEELRESEERFRSVVETANDAIVSIDARGNIVFWNHVAESIFNYSMDEIIGQPLTLIMPERFRESHQKGISRVISTEKSNYLGKTFELVGLRKDGSEFPLELSVATWKAGEETFFTGIMRDISERKQAEKEIREYSENLESMVEERTRELNRALYDTEEARDKIDAVLKSVADGLIVTDIYNRVILMNRAAEDLLGVRFSEVIGRVIDFAIRDETLKDRVKTTLDKKKEGYEFDFELPGEDTKHPRIMRARTSVIEDNTGQHTGIITIIYDVSHEREVDRMKTEFISTAAHELRTPLTSIQGFSELLLTRKDLKEEEKEEFLSYINKQSVNLAAIVNDLLDISRLESGLSFLLNKEKCVVGDAIKRIIPYVQGMSSKHKLEVVLPEEPVELLADKEKMEQVLKNLLSNTVKYSPEGGIICLTAKVIAELTDAEENSEICTPHSAIEISVADQGMGMTPEQIDNIFEKFYRVDASTSAIEGTGLGMTIVKHIVEAHGGKVWVESELGKGTTVTFRIPT